jgi:hypothetical protein
VRARRGQYSLDSVTLTAWVAKREQDANIKKAVEMFRPPVLTVVQPEPKQESEEMTADFVCSEWGVTAGTIHEEKLRKDQTLRLKWVAHRKALENARAKSNAD